jgi:hypothetical protein
VSSLHFIVPVASDRATVQDRFRHASTDPAEVVRLFTTSNDVIAEAAEGPNNVWRIRVDSPRFRSAGTTAVSNRGDGGSDIEIQIEIRGKGLLGVAGPLVGLVSGRLEHEAATALQAEFGRAATKRAR